MTTVSIVITNHDYERFLGAAIDSALAQDRPDTEVVVVDDGSSDGSRAVIESYGDRVRAVLKPNGGQGSAINAGFAASRGEVVIFLDADDELFAQAAGEAARALAATPRAVKAHWPLVETDEEGRPKGRTLPNGELARGDLRRLLSTSALHCTPPQSGNAWTRRFLERVLPMPEQPYRTGADTWLFVLAAGFGEVVRCERPLGLYRRHPGQDGVGRPFDEQVDAWLAWHEPAWRELARHCRREGLPADVDAWRRNSWAGHLQTVAATLDDVIPSGSPFVLVDGGLWSMRPDERRRALPCTPPAGDAEGIAELERLRDEGARFLVLAAEAFWWLDAYPDWARHVSRYQCAVRTDDLAIYELVGRTPA